MDLLICFNDYWYGHHLRYKNPVISDLHDFNPSQFGHFSPSRFGPILVISAAIFMMFGPIRVILDPSIFCSNFVFEFLLVFTNFFFFFFFFFCICESLKALAMSNSRCADSDSLSKSSARAQ